jgi:predicted nucleotidyltransferase
MPAAKNIKITDFLPEFQRELPETYRLLKAANLTVHPLVKSIILEGSRGPAGKYRPDSDIDLALVTGLNSASLPREELGNLLEDILKVTQSYSRCAVELDLAAVFDDRECGIACYRAKSYADLNCAKEKIGCMGVYKIQKGFNGFVPPIVQVSKIYPMIEIWQK